MGRLLADGKSDVGERQKLRNVQDQVIANIRFTTSLYIRNGRLPPWADSTGHRNAFAEPLSGRLEAST